MYNDDHWDEEENDDDLTKEAVERFEQMLESHQTAYFDADEFELIIDYYLKQNNLERSRQAVDLALAQHPDDLEIRIKNGYYNASAGNHQKAIDIYTKALAELEEDERGEMYYAIGYEYHSLGLVDKAVEYYNMALEENPQDTEVWAALGDLYRETDHLEEAIEMYEYALAIDPTHLYANMHLANSYYDLDRFQDVTLPCLWACAADAAAMIDDGRFAAISRARNGARSFGDDEYDQVDLMDFASRVGTDSAEALIGALTEAIV